jgi:hypothetical protein
MERIRIYNNGNYQVQLFEDGTKKRISVNEKAVAVFPETIDVNISNYCENTCKYCYISASTKGKHGNLNMDIFDGLKKGVELAINYAEHPELENFLHRMNDKGVIVNLTINVLDVTRKIDFIKDLQERKLIHGIGVSVSSLSNKNTRAFELISELKNVVAHVIFGVMTPLDRLVLADYFDNILMLGYKNKGRGEDFTPDFRIGDEIMFFDKMFEDFKVVSFDNAALKFIKDNKISDVIDDTTYEKFYMGEEGEFSMYIDTVQETYARDSTVKKSKPIKDLNIIEMFNDIRVKSPF